MDKEFIVLMQKLIAEQGKEALVSTSKAKALLADYTAGEYKKESRLLLQAIDAGVAKALNDSDDVDACMLQQARLLQDDYSLTETAAKEVVGVLRLVLRGKQIPSSPPQQKALNAPALVSQGKQMPSSEDYLSQGIALGSQRDWDAAFAIYNLTEAIIHNPKNSVAYAERGSVYYDLDEYDKAIADFSQSISLNPKYAFAYTLRGKAYRTKGDYDRAIEDATTAISLKPKDAFAYATRGEAYRMKGEYDRAIANSSQAISLDPKNIFAYATRGDAYRMKGEYDRAIKDATTAISLNPKNAFAYATRGEAYRMKGEYDRAIEDTATAIALNPKNAFAYATRGDAYRMKGEYDRAIADLSQTISLDPKNAFAYATRGEAYRMKGNTNQATRDLTEALRLIPNYEWAKGCLQKIEGGGIQIIQEFEEKYLSELKAKILQYYNQNDFDQMIVEANKAISLYPTDSYAYTARGIAYGKKGNSKQAMIDCKAALRVNPDDPLAAHCLQSLT